MKIELPITAAATLSRSFFVKWSPSGLVALAWHGFYLGPADSSPGAVLYRRRVPDRRTPFNNVAEKQTLVDFLDYLRESVILKLEGLTDEQARTTGVASGTSLLWL